MKAVLLIIAIAVVVALSAVRAGVPVQAPAVQRQCFPPGTTGVDGFEMCPEGYYGKQVDV